MSITNEQYNQIMRIYLEHRNRGRQDMEERREKVYQSIPRLRELDAEVAAEGTRSARKILFASSDSEREEVQAAYRQYTDRCMQERQTLLAKAGLPGDILSVRYVCPDCRDTGYIGTEKCHCFRQAGIDLLYRESHLLDSPSEERFEDFSLDYYPDTAVTPSEPSPRKLAEHALMVCRQFTEQFDSSCQNLFLYGDTGLGKTLLSRCIGRALIESAHSVIYFSAFRLFDELAEAAFSDQKEEEHTQLLEHITDCDLLIIDDLGTELTNAFVSSRLFGILNERILNKKPVIISTNLTLDRVAAIYTERIFSRLTSEFTFLKLSGKDIRLQKKLSH